jgi:hypothetical protein
LNNTNFNFFASRNAGFLAGGPVFNAFFLVDGHHTIFDGNSLSRAFSDAALICNTACLTDGLGNLAGILGAARFKDPGILGQQVDNPLGTGLDTGPTGHTFFGINDREIVDHGDGVKATSPRALAKTDAPILAV